MEQIFIRWQHVLIAISRPIFSVVNLKNLLVCDTTIPQSATHQLLPLLPLLAIILPDIYKCPQISPIAERRLGKAKCIEMFFFYFQEIFTTGTVTGCTPFEEFTSYSGPEFEYRNISINPREDVALMPYSSGTTGTPKGVLLTHRNIVTNIVIT